MTPSSIPTSKPSLMPSTLPTKSPSSSPSGSPSSLPSSLPSTEPSSMPSVFPSMAPSSTPTSNPSLTPSTLPTKSPSSSPSNSPSSIPTSLPSVSPTAVPTLSPSSRPSSLPTFEPSVEPSLSPSKEPSATPSGVPSMTPSSIPTSKPSLMPSTLPTKSPSSSPSGSPSSLPSSLPTSMPSLMPSTLPSELPSLSPSVSPSSMPSLSPSSHPSYYPSVEPSSLPSIKPSATPTLIPSSTPTRYPTTVPSSTPTLYPSLDPCIGYDGFFADTSGSNRLLVYYEYEIESDLETSEAMSASTSDMVSEIEFTLLNYLISSYFPLCDSRRKMMVHESEQVIQKNAVTEHDNEDLKRNHYQRILTEMIGLSSYPVDLANGATCQILVGNRFVGKRTCTVIEGRLSIYLSDLNLLDSHQSEMVKTIKEIMNRGELNTCHPAIESVRFRDNGLYNIEDSNTVILTDDGEIDPGDAEFIVGTTSWILIGAGASVFLSIIVITRYRYTASSRSGCTSSVVGANIPEDDSSSGAYIDVSDLELQRQDQL